MILKLLTRFGRIISKDRDNENKLNQRRHGEYLEPRLDLIDKRVKR